MWKKAERASRGARRLRRRRKLLRIANSAFDSLTAHIQLWGRNICIMRLQARPATVPSSRLLILGETARQSLVRLYSHHALFLFTTSLLSHPLSQLLIFPFSLPLTLFLLAHHFGKFLVRAPFPLPPYQHLSFFTFTRELSRHTRVFLLLLDPSSESRLSRVHAIKRL